MERTHYLAACMLAAAMLLGGSPAALAGSIQLHLHSKHWSAATEKRNEENWGIGWRGDGQWAPMLGYYTNSYFKRSVYAGASFESDPGIYLSVLAVSGYQHTSAGFPSVGAYAVVPLFSWRMLNDQPVSPMLSATVGVFLFSVDVRY